MIRSMTSASERIGKRDIAIAAVLSALGVLLMDLERGAHRTTRTGMPLSGVLPVGLAIPLFLLVTVPLLWRRAAPLAAVRRRFAGLVVNEVLIGTDVVRCGVVLPTACLFAFTAGAQLDRSRRAIGLALAAGLTSSTVVRTAFDPLMIVVFVARDRRDLGHRPRRPLAQADGGRAPGPHGRAAGGARRACAAGGGHRPRAALRASSTSCSSAAWASWRGWPTTARSNGDAPARPRRSPRSSARAGARWRRCAPWSACLRHDRGGARRRRSRRSPISMPCSCGRRAGDARLTVEGNPRVLPAGVELSAYRIVEHLLDALEDAPGVEVRVRFGDDALELAVSGPARRRGQAAIERARERVGSSTARSRPPCAAAGRRPSCRCPCSRRSEHGAAAERDLLVGLAAAALGARSRPSTTPAPPASRLGGGRRRRARPAAPAPARGVVVAAPRCWRRRVRAAARSAWLCSSPPTPSAPVAARRGGRGLAALVALVGALELGVALGHRRRTGPRPAHPRRRLGRGPRAARARARRRPAGRARARARGGARGVRGAVGPLRASSDRVRAARHRRARDQRDGGAGQRRPAPAARDPEATAETFEAIAGAARQAEQDMGRLVALLGDETRDRPRARPGAGRGARRAGRRQRPACHAAAGGRARRPARAAGRRPPTASSRRA